MNQSVTQMGVQLTKGTLFLVNYKDEVNFALLGGIVNKNFELLSFNSDVAIHYLLY